MINLFEKIAKHIKNTFENKNTIDKAKNLSNFNVFRNSDHIKDKEIVNKVKIKKDTNEIFWQSHKESKQSIFEKADAISKSSGNRGNLIEPEYKKIIKHLKKNRKDKSIEYFIEVSGDKSLSKIQLYLASDEGISQVFNGFTSGAVTAVNDLNYDNIPDLGSRQIRIFDFEYKKYCDKIMPYDYYIIGDKGGHYILLYKDSHTDEPLIRVFTTKMVAGKTDEVGDVMIDPGYVGLGQFLRKDVFSSKILKYGNIKKAENEEIYLRLYEQKLIELVEENQNPAILDIDAIIIDFLGL